MWHSSQSEQPRWTLPKSLICFCNIFQKHSAGSVQALCKQQVFSRQGNHEETFDQKLLCKWWQNAVKWWLKNSNADRRAFCWKLVRRWPAVYSVVILPLLQHHVAPVMVFLTAFGLIGGEVKRSYTRLLHRSIWQIPFQFFMSWRLSILIFYVVNILPCYQSNIQFLRPFEYCSHIQSF